MKRPLTADEAAVLAAGGTLEKSAGKPDENAMPESQMGAEGGLSKEAPGSPMTKSDDDDEDDIDKCKKSDDEDEDDEDEDEDEDEGEDMEKKKSLNVSEDDLTKALDHLEAISEGIDQGQTDRRADLAEKLVKGLLTDEERVELMEIVGSEQDEGENMEKSVSDRWSDESEMGADYDVSPFLEKLGKGISEALDEVKTDMRKSADNQQVFNRALAKSFKGIGRVVQEQQELIKSLAEQNDQLAQRLGVVESSPMPRKSRPTAAPLQKSFVGQEGGGDELSRAEIFKGLESLMIKSRENNWMAPCGEPIERAITQFESSGQISRPMLRDVAKELNKNINV
jgi:hypothetical protein